MTNDFKTRDLYVAAMLYGEQRGFMGIKRESNICWFIFKDKEKCEKLEKQFYAKEIDINAKIFSDSIKTLKNLIFANE
jgi:hypothetical protein